MLKHYSNKPFSNDKTIVEGEMNIKGNFLAKLLMPLFKIFGILVPYQENAVKTIVTYSSEIDSKLFRFDRIFYFTARKPYNFSSKMAQVKDKIVIEMFKLNLVWKMKYVYEKNKVMLLHQGYYLKIRNLFIPLPLELIIGEGYAEEYEVSDDKFAMKMQLKHFLFGNFFEYSGQFRIVSYAE